MRLLSSELDKRLEVKLNKTIKSDGANGIMTFGENNDYPQIIERIINSSVTSKSVANIYARFLIGQGFNDESLNSIVVGRDNKGKDITLITMLRMVANSISFNNGFYIHANFNLKKEVVNTQLMPFKNCRFAKIDDTGYTSKIAVYDAWEEKHIKKDSIVWFNVFNTNEEAFKSQVKKAGNIKKFKGQIFFEFLDNQFLYPLSPFDPVYMDSDTEFQIQLFKNRQIRDGFLDKIVFRVESPSNEDEKEELTEGIRSFIGPDGDSVLILEDELDENGEIKKTGAFAIDKIESNVNDKLFENWEKGLSNNIRKSNKAIPAILIDYEESKLGTTSGEAIDQATNFYNAMTQDDRAFVSEAFKKLYKNFANDQLKNAIDWSIKPLNLYGNATTNL